MTNLILLSVLCIQTNIFPWGARDSFGGWAAWYSWNAQLTYVVPSINTTTTYVVEYTYNVDGSHPMVYCPTNGSPCITNGWWGMPFTELNVATNVQFLCCTNEPGYYGYYINYPSNVPITNTIRFPIPPLDRAFFRMKKVR